MRRVSRRSLLSVLSVRVCCSPLPVQCLYTWQVESYWSLWTHLAPPSSLQPTTDYLLFHSGIRRPVWEDPLNLSGGKWIIRLKKGVADRIWEDLVMAIIGDQFEDCRSTEDIRNETGTVGTGNWDDKSDASASEWPEICGCTISVRQSEDIVTLWNRVDGDAKLREKIRYVICLSADIQEGLMNSLISRRSGTHYARFSACPKIRSWSTSPTTVCLNHPFVNCLPLMIAFRLYAGQVKLS